MPVLGLRDRFKGLGLGGQLKGFIKFQRTPKTVEPRSILIVDGNAEDRRSTARRVSRIQYKPIEAANADEALDKLTETRPDCVLLAMDLPGRSGLDLLTELRQLQPDLEVVMLTRDWHDGRSAEAMRRGAVAYLAQPFSQDDLRELLR